jgi:hypothetical protein
VFSRDNLFRALQRVESNRGAGGVDGLGGFVQRLLAHGRFAVTRSRPAQCPLAATRLARI